MPQATLGSNSLLADACCGDGHPRRERDRGPACGGLSLPEEANQGFEGSAGGNQAVPHTASIRRRIAALARWNR